ncbi:Sugar kinase, ROK family [Bifidobacterium actinocoloniiforme DSM 22766]|uniref:Sugar kinase, ROK family n=1 Tax=Bifidobacterium actinocoloniiforme DSM 22766 TaxID=1437605 RepID=A0A086YWG5_9BIFI|nr:ROK family protein [Bifidobacterium actinocoloniiforme]KFI38615.1 Sugar kinase, ROK family [Bifidobacterium actinocoloniiforme DSM 22766]
MTEALQSSKATATIKPGLRLGIDVGGTKIEGVALDESDRVVAFCRQDSHQGNQSVLEDVVNVTHSLLTQIRQARGTDQASPSTASLGIGIPGLVDSARGLVSEAVNLSIRRMDLGAQAQAALNMPVLVENDVNAAALGASQGLDLPCVVFINLGTGLGSSIIQDGRIMHGATGYAGEIGHIPVDSHSLPCKCGQHGCLETVASGAAIQAHWPQADPPLPDIIEKAKAGQADAREALNTVISGIATAVQIAGATLDPDAIILGGGVTKTGPALLDLVKAELTARGKTSRFVSFLNLPARLRMVGSNQRIGAVGAALAGAAQSRQRPGASPKASHGPEPEPQIRPEQEP